MKFITLTKGQVAIVDDSDYEWLNQYSWYAQVAKQDMYNTRYYAARRRREDSKLVLMHREILTDALQVDHRDRNSLNNQRDNLRSCTIEQNNMNRVGCGSTSNYKGVYLSNNVALRKPWYAKIMFNGKQFWLGYHYTEEEAAAAYDEKAKELFGVFAYLNFSGVS